MESLGRFLEAREQNAAILLIRAAVEEELGDDEASLEALAAAREAEPDNATVALRFAEQLARAQRSAEALEVLERARANGEIALKIAKVRGRELLRLGNASEALKVWRDLIAANPEDVELREDVIELLASEGMHEEARRALRELLARTSDPYQLAQRRFRMADLLADAGNREQAMQVYRELLESAGQGTWLEREVLAQIAAIFRREGGIAGFRDFLQAARENEPNRVAVRLELARALANLREKEAAIAEFEALLKITPGDRKLREAFVALLADLRDFPRAAAECERLAELFPGDADLLVLLAKARVQNGDKSGAAEAISRFLAAGEAVEHRFLRAARLLAEFRLESDAERVFREAIDKFPDGVAARESAAEFFHRQGQKDEAQKIWAQLAASGNRDTLLRAANTAARLGYAEEAFSWLQARHEELRTDAVFLTAYLTHAISAERCDDAFPWVKPWLRLADSAYELDAATRLTLRFAAASKRGAELTGELRKSANPREICVAAALLAAEGDRGGALELLENLARQPGEAAVFALSQLARLHQSGRDYPAAVQAMERLVALPNQTKTANVQRLVELHRLAEQPARALEWLRRWKPLSPGNPRIWREEAETLHNLGRQTEAIRVLRQAMGRFADDDSFPAKLAQWFEQTGQNAEAEQTYRRLLDRAESVEDQMPWLRKLVDLARNSGRKDSLLAGLAERARQNRGSVGPLLVLAEARRLFGETDEWRETLQEASRLEPGNVALLRRIARSFREDGKFDEARAALERALPADASGKTGMELVRLLFDAGEGDAAANRLRSLVQRGKLNVTDAELASLDLARREGLEPAARFLRDVADLHPDDFRLPYLAGVFFEEAGLLEEAASLFQRVVRLPVGDWPFDRTDSLMGPPEAETVVNWWQTRGQAWGYRQNAGEGRLYGARFTFSSQQLQFQGRYRVRVRQLVLPEYPEISRVLAIEHLGKILTRLEGESRDRLEKALAAAGVSPFQRELLQASHMRGGDVAETIRQRLDESEAAAFWLSTTALGPYWARVGLGEDKSADFARVLAVLRENWPEMALAAALHGMFVEDEAVCERMRAYVLDHLPGADVSDAALAREVQIALKVSMERAPEDRDSPLRVAQREALTKGCEADVGWYGEVANLLAFDRDFDRILRVLEASEKTADEAWNQPGMTTSIGVWFRVPGIHPAMARLFSHQFGWNDFYTPIFNPPEVWREVSRRVKRPAWRFLFDHAAGQLQEPDTYLTDPNDRAASMLVAWHLRENGETLRALEILAAALPGAKPGPESEGLAAELTRTVLRHFREGETLPGHLHDAARFALTNVTDPMALALNSEAHDPFLSYGWRGGPAAPFDFAELLDELGIAPETRRLRSMVSQIASMGHGFVGYGWQVGFGNITVWPNAPVAPKRPPATYPSHLGAANMRPVLQNARRLVADGRMAEAARLLRPLVREIDPAYGREFPDWMEQLPAQSRRALLNAIEPGPSASDFERAFFAEMLEALESLGESGRQRAEKIYRGILTNHPNDEELWLRLLAFALKAGDVERAAEAFGHIDPACQALATTIGQATNRNITALLTASRLAIRWLENQTEPPDSVPDWMQTQAVNQLWGRISGEREVSGKTHRINLPRLLAKPGEEEDDDLPKELLAQRQAWQKERVACFEELSQALLRRRGNHTKVFLQLVNWRRHSGQNPAEGDIAALLDLLRKTPLAQTPQAGSVTDVCLAAAWLAWQEKRTNWLSREVIPALEGGENAANTAERLRALETMLFGPADAFLPAAERLEDASPWRLALAQTRQIRAWRDLDPDLADLTELTLRGGPDEDGAFGALIADYCAKPDARERTFALLRRLAKLRGVIGSKAPEPAVLAKFAATLEQTAQNQPVCAFWLLDFARSELPAMEIEASELVTWRQRSNNSDPFADLGGGSGPGFDDPGDWSLMLVGTSLLAPKVEDFRAHLTSDRKEPTLFHQVVVRLRKKNAKFFRAKLLKSLPKDGFGPELLCAAIVGDQARMSKVLEGSKEAILAMEEPRRVELALVYRGLIGPGPPWIRQNLAVHSRQALDRFLAASNLDPIYDPESELAHQFANAAACGAEIGPILEKARRNWRIHQHGTFHHGRKRFSEVILAGREEFAKKPETSFTDAIALTSQLTATGELERELKQAAVHEIGKRWAKRLREHRNVPFEQFLGLLNGDFRRFADATQNDPGARLLWPIVLSALRGDLTANRVISEQTNLAPPNANAAMTELHALFVVAGSDDWSAIFHEFGYAQRLRDPSIPLAIRLCAAPSWKNWLPGDHAAEARRISAEILAEAWNAEPQFVPSAGSTREILRAFAPQAGSSPENRKTAQNLLAGWNHLPRGSRPEGVAQAIFRLQLETGDAAGALRTVHRNDVGQLGDLFVQFVDRGHFDVANRFLAIYGGKLGPNQRPNLRYTAELGQKADAFLATVEIPDRRLLARLILHGLRDDGVQSPSLHERLANIAGDLPAPEHLSRNTLRLAAEELVVRGLNPALLRHHLAHLARVSSPAELIANAKDEKIWTTWWRLNLAEGNLDAFAPVLDAIRANPSADSAGHMARVIANLVDDEICRLALAKRLEFARAALPILRQSAEFAAKSEVDDPSIYVSVFTAHLLAGESGVFAKWRENLPTSAAATIRKAVANQGDRFLRKMDEMTFRGLPENALIAALLALQNEAEFAQISHKLNLFGRLARHKLIEPSKLVTGKDPPGFRLAEALPRDGYAWAELADFAVKAKLPQLAIRCYQRAVEAGENAPEKVRQRWQDAAEGLDAFGK